MSSPITIAGSLTMQSSNGDGSRVLTAARDILTQLQGLGAQYAVRIELTPMEASPAVIPPTGIVLPVLRTDANGGVLPSPVLEHDAFGVKVATAAPIASEPVDPTPAAPAQPDEPQTLKRIRATIREELDRGETRFRDQPRSTRYALVLETGRRLTAELRHPLGMATWDQLKPAWMPSAGGICKTSDWPTKWSDWQTLFSTTSATPSGA